MTVWCLVELEADAVADASLRALTLARDLLPEAGAGGVTAVVFGDAPPADLAAYGVSDVYLVAGVDGYAPQAWARVLAELLGPVGDDTGADRKGADEATAGGPDGARHAVVAAGTEHGNEVLAHLGAITGLPMAANCVAVSAPGAGPLDLVASGGPACCSRRAGCSRRPRCSRWRRTRSRRHPRRHQGPRPCP